MKTTKKIEKIIRSVKHGKNIKERRIAALERAGFEVESIGIKWNFGRVGTMKETKSGIIVMISCATGGRARNGYEVNACPCVLIKNI